MFRLFLEVVLIDLAKLMGYRTLRALSACQNASDHHKAWQLLEIFMFGTEGEL